MLRTLEVQKSCHLPGVSRLCVAALRRQGTRNAGNCAHLTGERIQRPRDQGERKRLGSGDQAQARGSAERLHHRKRLAAYLWFGGPAAAPPRRCSRSRSLERWGLDSARVGFHSPPPRGGVTPASPSALSRGPLGTSDRGLGKGGGLARRHTWDGTLGGDFGRGRPVPPPTWVWTPRGARSQPVSSASLGGGQAAPKR